MKRRVKGDVGFSKLLRRLPDAARDGMADILDDYGTKLLAEMRRDVPVDTGFLRSLLEKKLLRKTLRLRVGFVRKRDQDGSLGRRVTRKTNRGRKSNPDQFVGKQFYGRFVEFGRKTQTVRVTRKAKLLRITGNNRSAANRRRHEYGPGVYTMRVRGMAGRPFIFKKRPQLRAGLRQSLSEYWDRALARAAEGVGSDD